MKNTKLSGISASLIILASFTAANAATTSNFLSDEGFESNGIMLSLSTVVSDFNIYQNVWGTENGGFTAAQNGISPIGNSMHSLSGSGIAGQIFQFVSLSPYLTDIAAGNASFDISALFNSFEPGFQSNIAAGFYTSAGWSGHISSQSGVALNLDSDLTTWESASINGAIPTNAQWIGIEVLYNTASLQGLPDYVDETSLTITTIPEPSSTLLLGVSGLALLARRRRVY